MPPSEPLGDVEEKVGSNEDGPGESLWNFRGGCASVAQPAFHAMPSGPGDAETRSSGWEPPGRGLGRCTYSVRIRPIRLLRARGSSLHPLLENLLDSLSFRHEPANGDPAFVRGGEDPERYGAIASLHPKAVFSHQPGGASFGL